MHNANETLIMNFDQVSQLTPKIYKLGTPYNNRTSIYNYITLAKALENLNDPSRSALLHSTDRHVNHNELTQLI